MIDTKDLVIIDKAEYAELVGKAAIYDALARKLKADVDRRGYVSEYEQAMFIVKPEEEVTNTEVMESLGLKYEDEEEVKAIFTEEEWDEKVVPLVDEED